MRVTVAGVALALAALSLPGCSALFRSPAAIPVAGEAPAAPWEMNAFVLTAPEIGVEVDWVEGCAPSPRALLELSRVLREVVPGREVDVNTAATPISRELWDGTADREALRRLIEDHLSSEREPGELIYVLYAPEGRRIYGSDVTGMTENLAVARGGSRQVLSTVLLFADPIRKKAMLWIGPERVERAVIVHELGHVLGLVSNPEHVQRDHPHHCTEAGCVMNQPRLRSLIYNALPALFAARVPTRYCARCRADIDAARRWFKEIAT